ncbi:helix-turn-helix transcriptional regulator [Sphingobium sufflavum]|uniref:helix-turn-helix transcriptional regulator n=1 Tax=Sphingobium sufflavum TaxID=1129547 RepID=UPI001F23686C|nr:helix-turn-helix transcriptional regulator [Sphingobium sufflavum]MCE7797138.1 helix-turn-helix transcriptional regulator [Sphingobium sufflavum]
MKSGTANEELIAAILNGAFETPLWSTFLTQLRATTNADFCTLIFSAPGRPLGEAVHLFAGEESIENVDFVYHKYHASLDFLGDLEMQEGRVYGFDELYPPKPQYSAFYNEIVVAAGITECLMAKVVEPSGIGAWLCVSRRTGTFTPRDEMLMKQIVPLLRGALRGYVALEQQRFTATITGDAMRRLHFAWMTLDGQGRIIDHDIEAGRVLTLSNVLAKGVNGMLAIRPNPLKSDILAGIRDISQNPQARARAFTLNRDPWLDMLLLPMTANRLSANPKATVIAYIHGDSWHATDRCEQLSQLFGLSRSEAKLALAVSRGMTIAQAAESLGIKIETARKCSKIIYAKTGAGGMPDLVRIVMRSVLALAHKD